MDWNAIDWASLERMRENFLGGSAGRRDYWRRESDLASYDQTFGRRIAWKWDYVLADLKRLGWSPPSGEVLDWGCGSGVAGRALLAHFGVSSVAGLVLWDTSRLALEFALRQARESFPGLAVRCGDPPDATGGTLLVSHVITELSRAERDGLVARASRAAAVIWVEPGTFQAGRALIAVRERLRGQFQVAAPCTHQAPCGMLAQGRERHWCHHFAPSPPEAFTDGHWARFARVAGIDLRSLPLSYLVLDARPAPPLPAGAVRLIGRARVEKAFARLLACDASGLSDRRLAKRASPQAYRRAKENDLDPLQVLECDGDVIVTISPR